MRIIPARAGFTGRRARFFQADADHPRSRGVYTRHSYYVSIRAGSSPLARGLPRRGQLRQRQQGIIPARAGFTLLHHLRFRKGRDHPRSRGVYPRRSRQVLNSPGSSPLARGLPVAVPLHLLRLGIIPARAGFTSTEEIVGADSPGSSPLARGLPHAGQIDRYGRGIIPARAGFTGQGVAVDPLGGDHPRSRGVYETAGSATSHRCGSSPLARGLPAASAAPARGRRIIPARAGFTGTSPSSPTSATDHPRSRGVYVVYDHLPPEQVGSSPLARGLRVPAIQGCVRAGIIPARAGFTFDRSGRAGEE